MLVKKKVSTMERQAIISLAAAGNPASEIAKQLAVDGRTVSGIIAMARRAQKTYTGKGPAPFTPLPPPTKEEQLKALAKAWKETEPEAEFSLHTEKGQTVYIGNYKGGLVLRVGEQKKVAFLTPGMAQRLGSKLMEMAQWSMQLR